MFNLRNAKIAKIIIIVNKAREILFSYSVLKGIQDR